MWRSRIFWRLFGSIAGPVLLALGLLTVVIDRQIENAHLADVEDRLRAKALLVREALRGSSPEEQQELVARLGALPTALPARVTLIASDGRVLAESSRDPTELENHGDRPEVLDAAGNAAGHAVRYSSTTGQDMMYFALPVDLPGARVRFIRVSSPLANVRAQVERVRVLVALTAALTALLALVPAYWLARAIARPVRRLTDAAGRLAAGGYGERLFAESNDELGRLTMAFNDMSERLALQFRQLEEDRARLRTVLGSMVEGVVALDGEQRILFANERACTLLDFPLAGALGRPLWQLVRLRPLHELLRGAPPAEGFERHELRWSGPADRSLTVHVAPLPGRPPRGAVLVLHDTTELRRLERLRQEFVANVSHELKTPLAVIQACVETLLDGAAADPEHRGQFLHRVAHESRRLHNLILDLLQLARLESETEALHLEAVDAAEAVADCLQRHRTFAEGKQQVLEAEPPPAQEAPPPAWADTEAVQQILDNLVNNALKYTPEGGRVTVRWRREGAGLALEVADTGIGIPAAELPRVFERFYRVDRARSRELGGTGLGLSIVKHLAQAMQGSVRAASRPGAGSTFTVVLPAAVTARGESSTNSDPSAAASSPPVSGP